MNIFVKYKKLFIGIVSILVVLYAVFLLVIPNIINLNNFKKDIQKIVFDSAKLNFDFENLKIVTTPNLKAGVKITGAKLSYPNENKIAELKSAEVKLALLPLLLKTIQVSDVVVVNPEMNLVYTKDFEFDVVKYIFDNVPVSQSTNETAAELPLKISNKLPKVVVKDYKLNLKDEKTSNKIILDGQNFVLDNTEINKKLEIMAKGKFLVNNSENILYDVNVKSFWPVVQSSTPTTNETQTVPQIDFINELVKFNPKAEIVTDLQIKEHSGHVDIVGDLLVDKISIVLDGKKLPDSYVKLTSAGHKIHFDSNLYIGDNEKAEILANITQGKKKNIDLNVKIDKLTFVGIQNFVTALLNSFNIKNDLKDFVSRGYITANFSLNTDLKKFSSSGFLKVIDGNIFHKTIPVKISDISADINLNDNNLNINKAISIVNGAKITVLGGINSKANANISVKSDEINMASLFSAFAPADLKKTYILKNGLLTFDVLLNGQLSSIEPNVIVKLVGFDFKDKLNTFSLVNELVTLDLKAKNTSFVGNLDVKNTALKLFNSTNIIKIPNAKVTITPENIEIVPFFIQMNSSKIDVSGLIKDYMKQMKIDINADGFVFANDLKKLLPKEVSSIIGAKGKIPMKAKLFGNAKKIDFVSQIYSDGNNYFSPIIIKKVLSKPSLLNLSISFSGDQLDINDASLYLSTKAVPSNDFAVNLKGATKIAGLSGSVFKILSSYPEMKLNFAIPEQLGLSTYMMQNLSLNAKGDINISGHLNNPNLRGFVSLKNINVPDLLCKVQDVDIELSGNTLSAMIQNLDLNGTLMNIDADASTTLGKVFLIRSMKITSPEFDVDKLFKVMDKMATMTATTSTSNNTTSTSSGKGLVLPVKISNGVIDIKKLKMKQIGGDFIATNILGDFQIVNDLFKLKNLKTDVYKGVVTGEVSYHLGTTAITANVKGKKVDANPVLTVFVVLKDQMMGFVDFVANVKLKGATYEQQMKSLNGDVTFEIKDGQMGSLGRFETFLKADNLLSQSFVVTKVGSLINAIAPYNTGKFAYLNGVVNIKNGTANLNPIKISGPHMALLLTGNVNILSMNSSLKISGSLSPQVVGALGPIADLSVEKFAAYIPKFGDKISTAMHKFNTAANKTELGKIPALTPENKATKSFKVVLNGNLNNPPSAIKSFSWLNTHEKIKEEQQNIENAVKSQLPQNKEELKEQLKENLKTGIQNQLEKNEKVQEIKQNKTVKNLTDIYKFYKQSQPSTTAPAVNE